MENIDNGFWIFDFTVEIFVIWVEEGGRKDRSFQRIKNFHRIEKFFVRSSSVGIFLCLFNLFLFKKKINICYILVLVPIVKEIKCSIYGRNKIFPYLCISTTRADYYML